jgi:hypothetical protein
LPEVDKHIRGVIEGLYQPHFVGDARLLNDLSPEERRATEKMLLGPDALESDTYQNLLQTKERHEIVQKLLGSDAV